MRSRDAARCFRLALEYEAAAFGLFNVSAADSIGRVETLARMEQVYGRLPPLRDPDRYARDPHAGILTSDRAAAALGWRPEGDWRAVGGAQPG